MHLRRVALLVALVVSVFVAIAARAVMVVVRERFPAFVPTLVDLGPFLVAILFYLTVRNVRRS